MSLLSPYVFPRQVQKSVGDSDGRWGSVYAIRCRERKDWKEKECVVHGVSLEREGVGEMDEVER